MAPEPATTELEVGATVTSAGVLYRVWSPGQPKADVVVERNGESRRLPLRPEGGGYWSAVDEDGRAGDLYRFKLGDGPLRPDVASRFQPEGVHGPSECIDPRAYRWRCQGWRRPRWAGQTLYEIHVGTLTAEGTFAAAARHLRELRELGIEAIEFMPLADFAGDRNWGYDGVCLFAPARCSGRPDDLRSLIDEAHGEGLLVVLDLVYNHLGPQGNYLGDYSPDYFRSDRETPWGRAFNLDGPHSAPVRALLLANAGYWLDEFRFDGIRLDATHAIPDASDRHILQDLTAAVHARGGFVIAEDERNFDGLLRRPDGSGYGIDAAWADDFHHQVRVALTGTQHAYFANYTGSAADLADTLSHGWSYRGQAFRSWDNRARGTPSDHLPARAFVYCIENHDQVGNRAFGERLEHLVSGQKFRAASLFLCLCPYPVMLFMGQEWAASTPFLFFCDHGGDLGERISEGRQREFGHESLPGLPPIPDPEAAETFRRSKLRWDERGQGGHGATLALYRACLRERQEVLRVNALHRKHWSVIRVGTFLALRYLVEDGGRMLLATFGTDLLAATELPALLQPDAGFVWSVVLDSDAEAFGGQAPGWTTDWVLRGPGALWLAARKKGDGDAPQL